MVRYGLGYAIIPGIFVSSSDGLHQQELIRRNGQAVRRNTWLVYKESVLQQATVGRFVDLMRTAGTQHVVDEG
jgi:DNA-binding transcriptional LysR family regulator